MSARGDVRESYREISGSVKSSAATSAARENRDQFKSFTSDAVRNDVRRVRDDELSRANHPPRPADLRLRLEKLNGGENALSNKPRILLGIPGDGLTEGNQVANGATRPDHFHLGAFASPRVPQLFSHFETFS